MAKEELENEELEEEDEEEFDLVAEYRQSISDLMQERKKYGKLSEEYMILTQRIADETENLRNAESAMNERSQRITAEKNRYTGIFQAVGNFVGNFGGQLVNTFMNRKNVKTVVGYEEDGGIVRTQATKFIK